MQVLAALSAVDWVVPFGEDTPERLICEIWPDVLVKGGDYRPEDIAGYECVKRSRRRGGRAGIRGGLFDQRDYRGHPAAGVMLFWICNYRREACHSGLPGSRGMRLA